MCAGPVLLLIWPQVVSGMKNADIFRLLGGFSSTKGSKDTVMCVPWGGTRTLPQGCTIVSWLLLSHLCIPSLSLLATVESALWIQGRSWSLKFVPYKQGMGDTERLLWAGAPQGPAEFHHKSRCRQGTALPFVVGINLSFRSSVSSLSWGLNSLCFMTLLSSFLESLLHMFLPNCRGWKVRKMPVRKSKSIHPAVSSGH